VSTVISGKAPGSTPCERCGAGVVLPTIAGKRVPVERFPDPTSGTVVLTREDDASMAGRILRGGALAAHRASRVPLYELHAINCSKSGKR
jgi:hypothetical protein